MNGQRMACVLGRSKAVRPLLSAGPRLIGFAQNPAAKHLNMKRTKDIAKATASRSTEHIVWLDERAAAGKALRDKIPRELHGRWNEVQRNRKQGEPNAEKRERARLRSERRRRAHGIGPRKPAERPWLALGISRSTWYRRRAKAREAAATAAREAAWAAVLARMQWQLDELRANLDRCAVAHGAMAAELN